MGFKKTAVKPRRSDILFFLWEKIAPAFAPGRRLRMRAFFVFSCGGFDRKRKVSLLTELEHVFEWFSTKMPPRRGWGRVFHSNESRAGKSGLGETCDRSPKPVEPFIFHKTK
ncbi:MAG: hypothetical protein D6714_16965 [Bacteroidetes bacterium]|nr:MAG: hypothetical protein D6714_16965 [Bacteroidota bacterium]